ncbi:MAG: hypothetical protein IT374_20635 [Polyangiaceae bacterium]|nr:hypothetical protein [Polyangiaceae bacterium]
MKPVRWSALVLAELAAAPLGCGSPSEPAHPAPPAPSAAPAASTAGATLADPPGTARGLSGFVELAPGGDATQPLTAGRVQTLAFGRGLFAHYAPAAGGGPCPFAPPGACRFFRVAPLAAPLSLPDASAPLAAAQVGPWGAVLQAPNEWVSFGRGRARLYAVREGSPLVIDAIDDQGRVTPFLFAGDAVGLTDVHVLEGDREVFVVAFDSGEMLATASAKLDASGRAGELSRFLPLPIRRAPEWATARWVRAQLGANQGVAWGEWAAAPLGAGVAVAFVGVTPPPKRTPRQGVREPKGAKHGCGRPSRPLIDASVSKTLHLVAVDPRGAIERQVVVAELGGVAKAPALDLAPRADGGVTLLGKAYAPDLTDAGPHAPRAVTTPPKVPFEGAPLQTVEALGYDRASGEGMLVAREGDELVARAFDALGRPTGDARRFPAPERARVAPTPLARAGGAWVHLGADGESVLFVSGPLAGKRLEVPELPRVRPNHTLGVFPWGDGRAAIVRTANQNERDGDDLRHRDAAKERPSGLLIAVVDVTRGVVERPLSPAEGWPRHDGGAPKMTTVTSAALGPAGLVVAGLAVSSSGETRPVAFRARDAASPWQELPIPELPDLLSVVAVAHEGDVVVVIGNARERRAVWTSTGEARVLPHDAPGREAAAPRGALLPSGILPSTPGELAPAPNPDELSSCPHAIVTGQARLVLACVGHRGDGPSLRAGLRTLRY